MNPAQAKARGGDVFIVDNSDKDWKVMRYLREWAELSSGLDIASGYFELGALLGLEGAWQQIDHIRLLMGDDVSRRTKKALLASLEPIVMKLDASIEEQKEQNDFLTGVPGIVEALRTKKIECRVYTKDKFHAKAYITHGRHAVVGSSALVGSSNFTVPGLTDNVELNVQIRAEVEQLQDWYERHWNEAHEVTPEILQVLERHTAVHAPFTVYAKALYEYFRAHELSPTEWEETGSKIYPLLARYQRNGYHKLMEIGQDYGGAFLCDGVGLGKTYIGLMLIERLVEHDRKRVALIVPKAARSAVWEAKLKKHLPHLAGAFSNLVLFNHTDLLRGGQVGADLEKVKSMADVVIIDEAHHFRNPGLKDKSRYWKLYDLIGDKTVFMLTATPVNNRLLDLQHMIELFSRRKPEYFATRLGIHSLPGHFRRMEKSLEQLLIKRDAAEEGQIEIGFPESELVLGEDTLFRALVVQRSRAYVKQSQIQELGAQAIFPEREAPQVVNYSIKKTYGKLLTMVEQAFQKDKPLFSLAVYVPLAYYIGPKKKQEEEDFKWNKGRQVQLVRLIRTQFLKRFESSARAFEMSCQTLLIKLLAWTTKHVETEPERLRFERWQARNKEILRYVEGCQAEIRQKNGDAEEDLVPPELLEDIERLNRDEYNVPDILADTQGDLETIVDFLQELRKFEPKHDDKLAELKKLLTKDSVLSKHKVLIFSEYMDTAEYLREELTKAGFTDVEEVDSRTHADNRGSVITRFAPYYNDSSSSEVAKAGLSETRILISTDVLSEGLNLQDATRLINYDLHWNPVRLMQRIGRVDRRLDPAVEQAIIRDHPEQKKIRGKVAYWNFLPPEELDELLKLYSKVSRKTLRISKTFGIEGRKLLKPDDEYEALRDFNEAYEGTATATENMHLEFEKLMKEYPLILEQLKALPGKVFSGKAHPKAGSTAVFFCYSLPAPPADAKATEAEQWTEVAGHTRWYLFDLQTETVIEEPSRINELIRCLPDTPRVTKVEHSTLSEIRRKVENHIKQTYFKQLNAPMGVKAKLKAWMELS